MIHQIKSNLFRNSNEPQHENLKGYILQFRPPTAAKGLGPFVLNGNSDRRSQAGAR